MKKSTVSQILLVMTILSTFGLSSVQAAPKEAQREIEAVAKALSEPSENCNHLGFQLESHVIPLEKNGIFSPFSLYYCLSMACYGARGETREQMEQLLYYPLSRELAAQATQKLARALFSSSEASGLTIENANSLFASGDVAIQASFESGLREYYGASVQPVNFSNRVEASLVINEWISRATHQKIDKLLSPDDIHPDTKLMLANAIYFKGRWLRPFYKYATVDQPFKLESGLTKQVPTMNQSSRFDYFEDDSWQVAILPFESPSHCVQPALVVALPKGDLSLTDLRAQLKPEDLQLWQEKAISTCLDLELPRFCLRQRIDLSSALIACGMSEPFSHLANFSDICSSEHLEFDKVLHEAYFDLNEEGVEAAAVTTIGMKTTSIEYDTSSIPFVADHPFLFFLIDQESQTLLFFGQLLDPQN